MRGIGAAIATAWLALGCTPMTAIPEASARCAWDGAPAAGRETEYRYRVSVAPGGGEICAEVTLPRAASPARTWIVTPLFTPYVRDVAFGIDGAFQPARASGGGFAVPACATHRDCRVRYRALLSEAARVMKDHDYALEHHGIFLSPPSSWMLHPNELRAPFVLAVNTPPGVRFASGFPLTAAGGHEYKGDLTTLDETPYAAFGPLAITRKSVGGGEIDVALSPGRTSAAIDAWIDASLRAVTAYYGRFPIDHAALFVRLVNGRGIADGHTMGNGGASVLIAVGEDAGAAELADDWMLVHELVHVSFPDTGTRWAEEGLATYVEPIIRARAGITSPDEVWRGMIEGMPQGQPERGDRGLDHTDTWGRRYWGGAMYWLLADVETRKATGNERSIDDALRAINRAGGNVAARWDLDRALAIGEEGTRAPLLRALRAKLGGGAVRIDLDGLWKSLGVSLGGGRVVYDDAAPLAAIRRGIDGSTRTPEAK